MSKASKPKKNKVQKITEAEYAAYLSALKGETDFNALEKPKEECVCVGEEKQN